MPHLALLVFASLALQGDAPSQKPPQGLSPVDVVSALENAITDAIARSEPSVVAIARERGGKGEETLAVRGKLPPLPPPTDPALLRRNALMGFDEIDQPDYVASDYGSGVVIGPSNAILTAFHVVKGATRLVLRTPDGQVLDAEIIAADPRSDLAVIVPRDVPGRTIQLRPITINTGPQPRKGSFLIALGNPFNAGRDGKASATWGILSNTSRRMDGSQLERMDRQLRHYPTLLQLDAKLNLGMSGGAVVNLKGELVGITTNAANAGGFDSQAGYALPIDRLITRVISALRQGREVEYGFLGVTLSLDNSNRIENVKVGTPAGEGGLISGDEVLSVGEMPVTDSESLVVGVNTYSPGTPLAVKIKRGDQVITKSVVLSKLKIGGEVIATSRPTSWRGLRVDYASMDNRFIRGDELLEAMAKGAVLITEVAPGSAADEAGLKVGQYIEEVEGTRTRTPADFADAVAKRSGPVQIRTVDGQKSYTVR